MRQPPNRAWIINTFLLLCPLTGAAIFLNSFLSGSIALRTVDQFEIDQFFDLPSTTSTIVLAISILLPLVVAKLTHRLLGFLATASLLILSIAAVAWVHSYRAYDWAVFAWLDHSPPEPTVQSWCIDSTAGELLLIRSYARGRAMSARSEYYYFSPTRHRAIGLFSGIAATRNMADTDRFADTPAWLRRLGFARPTNPPGMNDPRQLGGPSFAMAVPYWFICLLTTPFPLVWIIRHRRRRATARRIKAGACPTCGYDLRATPDPDGSRLPTCPECGATARN